MKITIEEEKANGLSAEDLDILQALGIEITIKRPRLSRPRKSCPEPYNLLIRYQCCLCGAVQSEAWAMKRNEKGDALEGTKVPLEGFRPDKVKEEHRSHCSQCRERLLQLSKEELVKKLLAKAKEV
ncbi:MAG: hypothetical protein DRI40_07625 [Chloroflexi bacterium]|nr:MAG: hypothetical protein DRI40_07625 [Chloroflexota bacterium]